MNWHPAYVLTSVGPSRRRLLQRGRDVSFHKIFNISSCKICLSRIVRLHTVIGIYESEIL